MELYQQPESGEQKLVITYEKDYEIDDEVFVEPLIVLKPSGREGFAWWNGPKGRKKVVRLIEALKSDLTVAESVVIARITREQYYYFMQIHPAFSDAKQRSKLMMGIAAKNGLRQDVLTPGKDGAKTRMWYLERRQRKIYGRDGAVAGAVAPADATARIKAEAFLDKDGKVLASNQTSELLGDDNDGDDEHSEDQRGED